MRRVCVALASFVSGAAGFASLPSGVPSPDVAYTTDLSRIRNQVNPEAECWDLLNQRWTQVVSEKDTGGLVTVMKVDLPNGCKQLAHVHCGLHEAFYKLDDNGYAIWASASNGAWWEVAPVKGDFSYAPMGQGHGYTNGDVSSCSGDANVAGYTASSFTSHLVIKMPGFEHETRARTVPSASPAGNATCDLMANRIESGYSDAAKAAISAYGKTDPKFIPALLDLREGHVYAPADVKPVHYVHAADKAAETPDLASYKAFGVPTKVRRLMSSTEWKPAATAGRDTIGTGGVAQMNEVQFGGDASAWGTPTPNGFDVFIVVEGTIELVTFGASSVNLEPISGFVMKQASTAPYKYNCKTSGGCKLLHLIPSIQFALEFMQNPAYGLCAPGVANNKTSHCTYRPLHDLFCRCSVGHLHPGRQRRLRWCITVGPKQEHLPALHRKQQSRASAAVPGLAQRRGHDRALRYLFVLVPYGEDYQGRLLNLGRKSHRHVRQGQVLQGVGLPR